MVNFVMLLEALGLALIFAAMWLLLSGDGAREQKLMCYFLSGSLVQNVGYLLELTAATREVALAAVKVEYLGSMFVPILYCMFMCGYCYEKPSKPLMTVLRVLAAVDFAMLPVVFFCDRHGLFYQSMEWLETASGHHYLSLAYGPLYVVVIFCQSLIPFVLSLYVLCRAVLNSADHAARRQYASILAVSTLPTIALISYVLKLTHVFDLSPLALGLCLSIVAILVWNRRNYDFRHVAAEAVLNNIGDGVIALDDQKRLVSYNKAAARVFSGLSGLRLGESVEALPDFRKELLAERAPQNFDIGPRHYESHAKEILDSAGKHQGWVILVLDMTDTQNYIEEIKRVREQAERANMAKSEFLANMSHEIRTPMNAVMGLSDIIMEESRGSKVYLHARDIQSASKSLLAIINDILDLSKVESGKMELVTSDYYIKGLVGEVVGMMDMAASQRGLVLKHDFDRSMPCRYHGDEGRIKQILINLMNNAVKFTKEGYVRLSVRGEPGGEPGQELVTFLVEDTGCGIREEDQEKIFEDFRQVDSKRNRSVEGTGLGLSITRHLVQLMGGSLRLESVYGKGSAFTVTIPQRIVDERTLDQCPDVPVQTVQQVQPFTAPGWRVLVVDDNLVNRKVAKGFLSAYGFELTDAESGPEAIELVKQTRYDMIFMDHMMPGMDGIEAVRLIRRDCGENGTAPVVVALTANAMEGVREKFLENGFQDYIAKPLDRKALNELLLRWIPEDRRGAAKTPAGGVLDPDLIRIPGIDAGLVVKYQAGGMEDYRDLLELYCLDGKRKLGLLQELADSGDWEAYEIEVHGLKSASANVGAKELSQLAKAHELAADKGDGSYIRRSFPQLAEAYRRQLEDISAWLSQGREAGGGENALPELPREELAAETREALDLLEHFHSHECGDKVEALLCHRLPADAEARLREIREQLRMYEDDKAEELLRQLLQWYDTEG